VALRTLAGAFQLVADSQPQFWSVFVGTYISRPGCARGSDGVTAWNSILAKVSGCGR
jgi:hypothetical protein